MALGGKQPHPILDVRVRLGVDKQSEGGDALEEKRHKVLLFHKEKDNRILYLLKESLLRQFAANQWSALGLTLVTNCLFLFYI